MDHSLDIALNCPSLSNSGKPTFVGATRTLFSELEKGSGRVKLRRAWNKSTMRAYAKDYDLRLIKFMDPMLPLEEFEETDFDRVMDSLQAEKDYAESTVRHYRHLLWTVCDAAEQLGICENVLWGTRYGIEGEDETESELITKLLRTKKSFSVREQMSILNKLLKPPMAMSGTDMGLLIMLMTGMRNNEACGLRYEDIEVMSEHPEVFCAWVYKTTVRNRAELKGSGKTKNTNRVLPLLELLRTTIAKQRTFLEELVEKGELVLQAGTSVGDLPIVCKGKSYLDGCAASELTKAGKRLFRECQIGERTLEVLDAVLHSEGFQQMDVPEDTLKEKDATTYLLRRNMVTNLHLLGFSPAQLQYYVGHAVEDPYESRNFFTNEEKLFEVKELLERHPYELVYNCVPDENGVLERNGCRGKVKVKLKANQVAIVRVSVQEPGDELRIRVIGDGPANICVSKFLDEKKRKSGQMSKVLRYANVRGVMEREYMGLKEREYSKR